MNLALMLAERSTCSRLKVGSVVVTSDNQRVLGIGYNGSYRGGPNGCDSSEPGNCGCLHSEMNCLIKQDYDAHGRVMYVTTSPCVLCAKGVVNAGIHEVVYLREYRKTEGLEILRKAGVLVRKLEERDLQVFDH